MRCCSRHLVGSLFFASATLLGSPAAHAHFKLDAPACWLSQNGVGAPQKDGPCAAVPNTTLGDVAGTRTNIVTAVQPGQTVSVTVTATVAHPGWYRISLVEGSSSTQTLTSLPDPPQSVSTCTPSIMTNPVWSRTQPVLADGLPAGSTARTQQSGSRTFQVTIPATASCTSARPCTIQVLMVMTDHPANDCYYHHCADVAVALDAGAVGDGGGADAAREASSDSSSAGSTLPDGSLASAEASGTAGATGAGGIATGSGGAVNTGGGNTAGSGGATGGSGGSPTGGAAGTGGASAGSGGVGTGAATADGGVSADGASASPGADDGGCSCSLGRSSSKPAPGSMLVGMIALAALRRRHQAVRRAS